MAAMDRRLFVNGKLVADSEAAEFDDIRPEDSAAAAKGYASGNDTSVSAAMTPCRSQKASSAEEELQAIVASRRFVAFSLPECPQCDELKAALATRGVPASVFVKWDKADPQYPHLKAAMQTHAGKKFSFPQVFAEGTYQGGFADVLQKVDLGAFDELFEREFEVSPVSVQRMVSKRPMVVFSLPNCPQCDELRGLLEARGLPVHDVFFKWDKAWPQYQSLKTQLIQLIGVSQFTFPQTFVRSEYQGSFQEVSDKLSVGALDDFFSEAFGIAAPAAPAAPAQVPEAAIAFDEDF
eukprot:TRINITY_DN103711_c0_g1_i1.p1 TRINITY_DN103711_c0_g1~~TRINITY_DN103711_c0_g1_i1.p1  ORF type:complete len:294 (-),score=67.93 TRINITY_DN103711_c0_g1_i1:99-980(-)